MIEVKPGNGPYGWECQMSDQHENGLVTKVARAIYVADHEDLLGTEGYPEEVAERFARAALEASGITDLTRQLNDAREALEFYANPEIYKPHPHGPAFDRRDLSYHAVAALAKVSGP